MGGGGGGSSIPIVHRLVYVDITPIDYRLVSLDISYRLVSVDITHTVHSLISVDINECEQTPDKCPGAHRYWWGGGLSLYLHLQLQFK